MSDLPDQKRLIERMGEFDTIEILVNDKREMLFEGIIDAPYIEIHFRRIIKTGRHFDIIKLLGHHGRRSKETISEVIVKKDE